MKKRQMKGTWLRCRIPYGSVVFMTRGVAQPWLLVTTNVCLLILACSSQSKDPDYVPPPPAVEVTTDVTNIGGDFNADIDVESPDDKEPMLYRGEDCAHVLELTMRDFNSDHPDMQKHDGGWTEIGCGMVEPNLFLGDDGARTPVFQAGNGTGRRSIEEGKIVCTPWDGGEPDFQVIAGEDSFNQWYSNVEGVNSTFKHEIELTLMEGSQTTYYFDSYELPEKAFFPADGQGFNEQTEGHNYHFTTEAHVLFTYNQGDKFAFSGDDDLWIFVNGKLALDLGGMHGPLSATIDFDAQAADLGIVPDQAYNMDIFHAERHTWDSNFRIETNIACFTKVEVPEKLR